MTFRRNTSSLHSQTRVPVKFNAVCSSAWVDVNLAISQVMTYQYATSAACPNHPATLSAFDLDENSFSSAPGERKLQIILEQTPSLGHQGHHQSRSQAKWTSRQCNAPLRAQAEPNANAAAKVIHADSDSKLRKTGDAAKASRPRNPPPVVVTCQPLTEMVSRRHNIVFLAAYRYY